MNDHFFSSMSRSVTGLFNLFCQNFIQISNCKLSDMIQRERNKYSLYVRTSFYFAYKISSFIAPRKQLTVNDFSKDNQRFIRTTSNDNQSLDPKYEWFNEEIYHRCLIHPFTRIEFRSGWYILVPAKRTSFFILPSKRLFFRMAAWGIDIASTFPVVSRFELAVRLGCTSDP